MCTVQTYTHAYISFEVEHDVHACARWLVQGVVVAH